MFREKLSSLKEEVLMKLEDRKWEWGLERAILTYSIYLSFLCCERIFSHKRSNATYSL